MSVKIKVSYTSEEELTGLIKELSSVMRHCKVKTQKGRYKLAYIELNTGKLVHNIEK